MKLAFTLLTAMFVVAGSLPAQNPKTQSLQYLGQKPPGKTPAIFAPGVVSLPERLEFGSVFSADGKEFYYAVGNKGRFEVLYMRLINGQWTKPEKLIPDAVYTYNDPYLSPDESRLFFISNQHSIDKKKKDYDIFYVERKSDSWSSPINAGSAINSDADEYYVSFSANGTLYFSTDKKTPTAKGLHDVYASRLASGKFQEPVNLGEAINTRHYEADVFVAYDESYLIFCADRPDGNGQGDLYISFKDADGKWTKAKSMGSTINTPGHELCPFVTRDGKYFFYTSNRDIYWVDAGVLEEFR
jgi:Tol biopolymer transport system component